MIKENINKLEQILNYHFNLENYIDESFNATNDILIYYGNICITNTINEFLKKEFLEEDNKLPFDIDYLENIKNKILDDNYLKSRIINLDINSLMMKDVSFPNLFKSLIGSIYLDMNQLFNEKLNNIILNLLDLINECPKYIDYIENNYNLVLDWNKKKKNNNIKISLENDNNLVIAKIKVDNIDNEFISKSNKSIYAIIDAANKLYKYLEDNNLLIKMVDEVGYAEIDKAINQLQDLYVKGYIQEPVYKISLKGSVNGTDIWKCRIMIEGIKETFTAEDTSKKTAKRNAAYEMAKYLLK